MSHEDLKNIKPNSHKYKAEVASRENEKRVTKVAKGRVAKKKHTSFSDVFVSEDVSNVGSYVFSEVVIPAAKKLIWDIVSDGTSMLLYGETGRNKNRSNASRVSYTKYYDDPRDNGDRFANAGSSRRGIEYDNIIFESRGAAERVLDGMSEVIDRYGQVTILDLYDLADLSAPAHTSNKYGWTSIAGASPKRVRDGYILKLPRAVPVR